jgi:hypothetical protein
MYSDYFETDWQNQNKTSSNEKQKDDQHIKKYIINYKSLCSI